MVCNLNQNPSKRAIVSFMLPTLLRHGIMWLLINSSGPSSGGNDGCDSDSDNALQVREERYMMPKASWLAWMPENPENQ